MFVCICVNACVLVVILVQNAAFKIGLGYSLLYVFLLLPALIE